MSSSYSANQYNGAFKSQRLQNWCETKRFKERPRAQEGHTTFIANDKGHLLPGVVKKGSAWTDFRGTWDLPTRIPARHINTTGRSLEGLHRLRSWGIDPHHKTNGDVAAEAQPSPQSRPSTGGKITPSPNQDLQTGEDVSSAQPADNEQANEEKPVSNVSEHIPPSRDMLSAQNEHI